MADNVNDLFQDLLYKVRAEGNLQETRNGKAYSMKTPTLFSMRYPDERVLFHPERKANPYFHVMETVWMFAGSKDVEWLQQFNKGIARYADSDGTINGAYGHRWLHHFGVDQIRNAINELNRDPDTRQAVIVMYDPSTDYLPHYNDRPCNTNIYFRKREDRLDMTICNRSNDIVWGACGANAVHMSYLHELVAASTNLRQGTYYVMSNNLHIYEPHWHFLDHPLCVDLYGARVGPLPCSRRGKPTWTCWQTAHSS